MASGLSSLGALCDQAWPMPQVALYDGWFYVSAWLVFPYGSIGKESACQGWKDSPEKEMETHCRILAWDIPWPEEPGRPQSMGSQRVRTQLSDFTSLTSLSRRALRRTLLSDDLGLWKLHGRLTRFLRIYQQKHYQPGIKGTETAWNEERMTLRTEPKYRSLW